MGLGGRIVGDGEVIVGPQQRGNRNLDERQGHEYASVRIRWLAGIVDWLVAMVWSGLVVVIFFAPGWFGNYSFEGNIGAGFIYYFGLPIAQGVVILRHLLNAMRVTSRGDTFGHRLFGLRIVKANGGRIGWRRAVVRQFLGSPVLWGYFSPLLWALVDFFINQLSGSDAASAGLAGFIDEASRNWLRWGSTALVVLAGLHHVAMGVDRRGRGVHDRLVGTVVVRTRRN